MLSCSEGEKGWGRYSVGVGAGGKEVEKREAQMTTGQYEKEGKEAQRVPIGVLVRIHFC